MEERWKAFLIVSAFVLFYLCIGAWNYWNYGVVNGGQDFAFHWGRVQGISFGRDYPVGYHLVFSLFSWHQLAFYSANVFLVAALIPFLLFRVSRKWWAVAIYFCGVPLAHQLLYGATYPQALLLAMLLAYLCFRRNWLVLAALTFVSPFIHHQGLFLFVGVWVAEAFDLVVGKRIDEFIGKCRAGLLMPSSLQGLVGAVELFLIQLPLPVFYFGLKGMKNGFYALVVVGSFLAATQNFRAVSVAQVVFVVLSAGVVCGLSRKVKAGFVFFLLAQCAFYLTDFVGETLSFIALS